MCKKNKWCNNTWKTIGWIFGWEYEYIYNIWTWIWTYNMNIVKSDFISKCTWNEILVSFSHRHPTVLKLKINAVKLQKKGNLWGNFYIWGNFRFWRVLRFFMSKSWYDTVTAHQIHAKTQYLNFSNFCCSVLCHNMNVVNSDFCKGEGSFRKTQHTMLVAILLKFVI